MSIVAESLLKDAELLAAPVSAEAPSGIDLSYESDFDGVRGEIEKLTTLAGETPDWRTIVESGETLLRSRSKDLRLLTWMAAARTKIAGPSGLAQGLAELKAVCDAHWDTMFPVAKRAKARANLIAWLFDQISSDLATFEPTARDRDAVEALSFLLDAIDEFLSTKLGDAYGGLGALRSLMREKVRALPAEAAPSPAPELTPAPVKPLAASTAEPAPAPMPDVPQASSAADALPALRALSKSVLDIARLLRTADPAQAFSFRLTRIGAWLPVRQPPPAEEGRTKIQAPPEREAQKLKTLADGAQWVELLTHAEQMASTYIFWLDAHRLSAMALKNLGPPYQEAHLTVVRELVLLVQRLPQVAKLAFADGTPFADAATQSWLEEQAESLSGSGNSGGRSVQIDEEEQELKARFEEARGLVDSGKVSEGLSLANQLARRGADARSRFRARFELALLAIKAGQPAVARPILEGLSEEAERHDLEHWEPLLCSKIFEALLRSAPPGDSSASTIRAYDRLCRIDPALALGLGR